MFEIQQKNCAKKFTEGLFREYSALNDTKVLMTVENIVPLGRRIPTLWGPKIQASKPICKSDMHSRFTMINELHNILLVCVTWVKKK